MSLTGPTKAEDSKPNDKVPCVVCKEPILAGARVCIHCEKAQDWTRHLMRWGTVAGAAVAGLSLLSAAHSLRGLVNLPADLRFIPKSCASESLEIAVTNLGDKPAMLRRVSVKLRRDNVLSDKEMPLTVTDGDEIIGSRETRSLSYARVVEGLPASIMTPAIGVKSCTYVVFIGTSDFEHNDKALKVECPCPEL